MAIESLLLGVEVPDIEASRNSVLASFTMEDRYIGTSRGKKAWKAEANRCSFARTIFVLKNR
jgi:hypothetical protein